MHLQNILVVVIKEKEWCWNTHATYCTHALRFVAIGEGALNAAKNIHRKLGAHKMAMEFKSFVKCFIDSAFRYLYYTLAVVALLFIVTMLHYACAYVYTWMQIWIKFIIPLFHYKNWNTLSVNRIWILRRPNLDILEMLMLIIENHFYEWQCRRRTLFDWKETSYSLHLLIVYYHYIRNSTCCIVLFA